MQNLIYLMLLVLSISCGTTHTNHKGGQQSYPLAIVQIPSTDVVYANLGVGYNSLLADSTFKENCLLPDTSQTLDNTHNGPENYYFSKITSQDEFYKETNFTVDAQARYVIANASVSEHSFQSIKIKSENTYVLIAGKKLWQISQLKDIVPNPVFLTYLKANPDKFFDTCGDQFVAGEGKVTEIYGLLECATFSTEEKKQLDQSITASISNVTASASGAITSSIKTINNAARGKCTLVVTARGGKDKISTNIDTFETSMLDYIANATFDDGVPANLYLKTYSEAVFDMTMRPMFTVRDLSFTMQKSLLSMWRVTLAYLVGECLANDDKIVEAKIAGAVNIQKQLEADTISKKISIKDLMDKITACATDPYNPNTCKVPSTGWTGNPNDPIID